MDSKKSLRKIREEEEAAKELLKEVQDTRQQQAEEEMWKDLEEYIASWTQKKDGHVP